MDSPEVPKRPGERARILEAMVRVGATRGYAATTVAEVVTAAGVEESDFARHFAGKEDCFLAAYEAISDVLVERTAAAYEGAAGRPWAERIAIGLRALVELLASEADVARLAVVDVTAIPGDARLRYGQALERFVPFVEAGREASAQADGLPPQTARFAIGTAASLIFDEFRAGRGAELGSILPDLVFALTMPYLGVAAAEAEMRRVAELN